MPLPFMIPQYFWFARVSPFLSYSQKAWALFTSLSHNFHSAYIWSQGAEAK